MVTGGEHMSLVVIVIAFVAVVIELGELILAKLQVN